MHREVKAGLSDGRAILLMVWLAFAVFCCFKLLALYDRPMDYDSGYFGTVAKNVLNGYGYATSHSEKILFNPEITTGPAVIYPMLLLVSMFGNQHFIPETYITVSNLILCGLFTGLFLRAIGVTRQSATFLLSFYLLGSFYEPGWWHVCVGDLQVILVMLNIMLLIGVPSVLPGRRWAALLGALLAMGVLVKFSILMALPAFLVGLILQVWQGKVESRLLLVIIAVYLMLFLPFFIYKQVVLQKIPEAERVQMQANALSAGASRQAAGIGIFIATDDKIRHIKKSFKRSNAVLTKLFAAYGVPQFLLYALLLLPLLAAVFYLLTALKKGVDFPVLLAWAAGSFTVWHFSMSLAFQTKYTLQLVWFSLLYVLYLSVFRTRLYWFPALCITLLPFIMSDEARQGIRENYVQSSDRLQYRQETLQLADFLRQKMDRPPLAYCGWGAVPRAVFYLLPGSETTPDCYAGVARQWQLQADGSVTWRAPFSFWLVRDKMLLSFYPKDLKRSENISQFCQQKPLFDGRFYDVLDCKWESLESLLGNPGLVEEIRRFDDPLF